MFRMKASLTCLKGGDMVAFDEEARMIGRIGSIRQEEI